MRTIHKTLVPVAFEDGMFAGMRARSKRVARWLSVESESGVTAIEYGLIAALIAVFIIASVTIVGSQLAVIFTKISDALIAA